MSGKTTRNTFWAIILLGTSACAPINLEQRANDYAKQFANKFNSLSETLEKEAAYVNRDKLREIASKCLVDGACKTDNIKQWVSLLPDIKYYEHVAEIKKSVLSQYNKIAADVETQAAPKDKLLHELLSAQAIIFANLADSVALTTSITFPQIARQLQNKKLWTQKDLDALKTHFTDYICSPVFGLTDLRVRSTILSTPDARALLNSFQNFENFNSSYTDFKKKEASFGISNKCNRFNSFFSDACIVDTFAPLHQRQKAEEEMIATFAPSIQKICVTAKK